MSPVSMLEKRWMKRSMEQLTLVDSASGVVPVKHCAFGTQAEMFPLCRDCEACCFLKKSMTHRRNHKSNPEIDAHFQRLSIVSGAWTT